MTRRFVFADAHAAGIPREQRQVYVLVKELPMMGRLHVHRADDDPKRVADLPAEWLEEVLPPCPAEPQGEFYVIDIPNGLLVQRLAIQRALGGWAFFGGNKGGGPISWRALCARFRLGQDGGATITELVRGEALPFGGA